MGRVMSLMMFGSLGLVPVSMFVGGFFATINLTALLAGGGLGMTVVALLALGSHSIRSMGREPVLSTEHGSHAAVTPDASAKLEDESHTAQTSIPEVQVGST